MDFDEMDVKDLVLLPRERWLLRRIRWSRRVKVKDTTAAQNLHALCLVYVDGDTQVAEIKNKGKRYLSYRIDRHVEARLPVTISAIALVRSFWPDIMRLFQLITEAIGQ